MAKAWTWVVEMQFDATLDEFDELMDAVADLVMEKDNAMISSGIKDD